MRSKNLWIKLIAALLIVASMVTLAVSCDSDDSEDGENDSGYDSGIRAEDLTPSEDLTFTLTTDKKGYKLKSASKCKDEQIVIPSTYAEEGKEPLPVTEIASGAFKNNTKTLVAVYIPDSVTKITGGTTGAFEGCKSLTTVVCGSGLVEIGNRTFVNCLNLKYVTLREGLKKVGSYAFAGCENLETMVFPDSVETIGEACFQRCARMTSITFGKNTKKIGDFALYFCKNISTVKFNGTVKEWKKIDPDVSIFLSVTMTDVVKCSDGEYDLPELEGQNTLPVPADI